MGGTNSNGRPKLAVLMLACRDYEAMELALACHMAYAQPGVPFFILQNCRGDYDAERTLAVARRYENLFPETIRVIAGQPPDVPYRSIATALSSPALRGFDLICKVDDDAFPIAPGWLESLTACWQAARAERGERLAYATPLINNNNWGFAQLLPVMGLEQEYFGGIARAHRIGPGWGAEPYRILPATQIEAGAHGTIWGNPHIARWLHRKSTLDPDAFIQATRGLPARDVPAKDRYSINCMLFEPRIWAEIDDGGKDDEHMLQLYCTRTDKTIVCDMATPFVHVAYFTQREENRDLVAQMRAVYEPRLGHPFPIALRADRSLELEARLRWLETKLAAGEEKAVLPRLWRRLADVAGKR